MQDLTDTQNNALKGLAIDEGAHALRAIYTQHGAEIKFAGGCVRDALLGIAIGDKDLAANALPQDGMAWLSKAGITVKPTGITHGTITAIIAGKPYEITTLRRDVKTDGRHAEVAFGTSWQEDAERRDFTINGLFCDFDGQVEDYVGGLSDLAQGRIRFIGDAETRCREDYVRILRLFRFWSRFGRQPLDMPTLQAVEQTLDGLPTLSKQRVWMEFKKFLGTLRAHEALIVMQDHDVLSVLLDNHFCKTDQVGALQHVEEMLPIAPDALRRLAILLAYRTQSGWTINWSFAQEHFHLSNKEADHLRDLHRAGQASDWWMERLLAAVATFDRGVVIDICALAVALGHEKIVDLQSLLPDLMNVETPVFPVTANDLMTRGYTAGPDLGAALNKLRDYWLETNCEATRDQCLALA